MGRPPREPPLGDAIEFMRTVWGVDHALHGLSRIMESRLGLTGPQRLVVRMIGRMPGISAGGLASLLALDPSTLSGHLRRLMNLGVVRRTSSPDDRRRVQLTLTDEGERLDVAMPGTIEAAVAELLRSVTLDELEMTQTTLKKLARVLEKQAIAVEDGARRRDAATRRRKAPKRNQAATKPPRRQSPARKARRA